MLPLRIKNFVGCNVKNSMVVGWSHVVTRGSLRRGFVPKCHKASQELTTLHDAKKQLYDAQNTGQSMSSSAASVSRNVAKAADTFWDFMTGTPLPKTPLDGPKYMHSAQNVLILVRASLILKSFSLIDCRQGKCNAYIFSKQTGIQRVAVSLAPIAIWKMLLSGHPP